MILHTPDTTFKRLKGCWKRAERAKKGDFAGHPLEILWLNIVEFLNAAEYDDPDGFDLVLLDYFAMKVDKHLKNHMLDTDEGLKALLHEWKARMPCNPIYL